MKIYRRAVTSGAYRIEQRLKPLNVDPAVDKDIIISSIFIKLLKDATFID